MEFATFGHDNDGRFGPRTLSDISLASSASSMVQYSSTGSGHMQLDPSFTAAKNVHARRVKFMCSFSGKILPRPSDRKLRYVGGETRMISVPRRIHYDAFVHKMNEIYGPDFALKYQLPEEDLDALVSVSTDEDLENMMDECDRLEGLDGASRLRVFIFAPSDHDAMDLSNMADPKVAEQRYVEAVNAVAEGVARKHDDLVLAGSSRNSDELDAYSWNAFHSEVMIDNFTLPSPHTNPRALLCALDPPALSSHSAVTNQIRVPLDLVSNDGANRNNSFDAALTTPDFLDFECAGSASSSTSSQHDMHNRFANHIWAPSSQIQPAQESAWYNTNGENPTYMAMEIGKQAADSSRLTILPAIATFPHGPTMGMEELPLELQTEMPLSPGTALQKQLHVDQEILSNNFVGAVQQATVNAFRQQQAFQEQLLVEEQYPCPKQPAYSPLTELALGAAAVENASHAQVVTPYNVALPNSQEIAACVTTASSAPCPPPKTPLIDLTELGYETSYAQDGGIANRVAWTPLQPVFQRASNSVFSNSSAMLSPSIGKVATHAFSQEFQTPTTAFLEQQLLPNDDLGARMEASSWLATEHSAYVNLDLESSSGGTGMQPPGPLLEEFVPSHHTFTFESARGKLQQLDTNANQNVATPPPLLGDFPAVAMVSDLLQAAHLDDHFSHQAPNMGNSVKPLVDSLLDQHQGLNEVAVAGGNDLPLAAIKPSRGVRRDSVDDHSDLFHNQILSKEGKIVREQENVQGMSNELDGINIAATDGVYIPDTVSQVVGTEASCEVPPVTTLGKPLLETGHQDQLGVNRSLMREEEDMDLSLTVETAEVYQNFELVTEELETFEHVEDKSMNAAATAETEAIALGLQTIRNFDLEELRELGSGTFGTVYHGKWRGSDVAIKRIKSSVFTGRPPERDRLIADFWREACLLGQLHHPNVVAFYGVVPDGPGGTLATVTEYMVNGSLKQVLLKNERALDRRKRLLIAMDAAFGMEYLHRKNVVHFDMKCENLLVNLRDTQRPICKVGDLGLSKVKQQTMVSGGVRGTLPWMAPELLNGRSSLVSEKVDVFSFGIVLWELLTGEEPYADMHYGAIIGGIVNNTLRPTIPRWCNPAWRSLMERCWSANPSDRPTFSEIAGSLRAMEASLRQAPAAADPT